jgi:NAD(P)-dependent dehydrogenase (short-subunit alcohol dehydrogenase family)
MMTSFPPGGIALVIGAGGGIGQAVENALLSDDGFARVIGTRRTGRQALDLMHRRPGRQREGQRPRSAAGV